MNPIKKKYKLGLLSILIVFLQGCIYDYPNAKSGPLPGIGNDPTTVAAFIEVSFVIDWQDLIHQVDFSGTTKAAAQRPHRFVIEVMDNSGMVCHDVVYLADDEFANGFLRHRLSEPLGAKTYYIAAWYDWKDDDGNFAFEVEDLSDIRLINTSTLNAEATRCIYAFDSIDLRDYDVAEETYVVKEIDMSHPGGRFEVVATDIQQFITDNKEALNQGDSFTVHLSFPYSSHATFNTYAEKVNLDDEILELSGRLRLPFAAYEELKIAEGFLFCLPEDETSMVLRIKNSALSTVIQTEVFTFPIKRGHVTTIRGDFLTNSIDGAFSIDNRWDGIIEVN